MNRSITSKSIAIGVALFSLVSVPFIAYSETVLKPVTAKAEAISVARDYPFKSLFIDSDRLTSRITLPVEKEDIGLDSPLYLVALVQGSWLLKNSQNEWQSWDGDIQTLEPYDTAVLDSEQVIEVLNDQNMDSGEYKVFAGYLNRQGELVYNGAGLDFLVVNQQQPQLHRFRFGSLLENYIKDGFRASNQQTFFIPSLFDTTESVSDSATRVSETNIQEQGVDEADLVKTDGENLYAVTACTHPLINNCIRKSRIEENPAGNAEISTLTSDSSSSVKGMYLLTDRENQESDILVSISGEDFYWSLWADIWPWSTDNDTEIRFVDVSDSVGMSVYEQFNIDGRLISSRRIGEKLYVVTRYTPVLEGYMPYPFTDEEISSNEALLDDAELTDFIPKLTMSDGTVVDLVDAKDCYISSASESTIPNPSMITITAIPLDNPGSFTSSCLMGSSETVYMSTESLYLATTKYAYSPLVFMIDSLWDTTVSEDESIVYDPQHSTEIHKFSLTDNGVNYRGSVSTNGHLGWQQDKKPFRMGEHEGVLRVATSLGESWTGNSSTRVALIAENSDATGLEEISSVENLGKPGERLYAARFIGDRGFIVTFRITDPLYILDLADPFNPQVAGELEIEGYSDYLHPVSDRYLLGIGKDAIGDDSATDFIGRGAWYQGVKLSLFDIVDPANPMEVNSIILGKRGTESDVLYDHHAIAYVPPTEDQPATLAIPVNLHDTVPSYYSDEAIDSPTTYYDWTHTGLYVFAIDVTDDGAGVWEMGKLIVDDDPENREYSFFPDRSVIQGDAVHYIHNGSVYSSLISELE